MTPSPRITVASFLVGATCYGCFDPSPATDDDSTDASTTSSLTEASTGTSWGTNEGTNVGSTDDDPPGESSTAAETAETTRTTEETPGSTSMLDGTDGDDDDDDVPRPRGESSTGAQGCASNDDCPDDAPFCDVEARECVSCSALPEDERDGACRMLDADRPLCVEGACVACSAEDHGACDDACDPETKACVGCTSHEQCRGEAGCNLLTGTCLSEDDIVHVDPDGGAGTFPTIDEALAQLGSNDGGTLVLHESSDGIPTGNVVISGPRTIVLVAAPGESPALNGGLSTTVTISDGATVLVEGWEVRGAQALWIDDATVVLDRTTLLGGLTVDNGGLLRARNSIMTGVASRGDSTVDILYSTIVSRWGSYAIECDQSDPSGFAIRNSLLLALAEAAETLSPGCSPTIQYSASDRALVGNTNTILGSMNEQSWFVDLSGDNYRLAAPPASLLTAARWQDGDPRTDIDGTLRPTVAGTPDVAGAHVPDESDG